MTSLPKSASCWLALAKPALISAEDQTTKSPAGAALEDDGATDESLLGASEDGAAVEDGAADDESLLGATAEEDGLLEALDAGAEEELLPPQPAKANNIVVHKTVNNFFMRITFCN